MGRFFSAGVVEKYACPSRAHRKQLDKVVETDGQNNGQPMARPAVTTTDPVPELEHIIGRVDTKFADRFGVGEAQQSVSPRVFHRLQYSGTSRARCGRVVMVFW